MSENVRILTDSEIQLFIDDVKPITSRDVKQIKPKTLDKRQHMEYMQEVLSMSGRKYSIRVRLNSINKNDFSVIFGYYDAGTKTWYVLRRYNGNSHRHTNIIERTKIVRAFHIHKATERYQATGLNIDGYAESTEAYSNWRDALSLMLKECNFRMEDSQLV